MTTKKPGRPALPPGEKMVSVSVRMTPAQRERLRRIGPQRLRGWLDLAKE